MELWKCNVVLQVANWCPNTMQDS
uniref:Uncharacterized protein n=1 Tax=Rhizophora mucronata TaxID=61149 RepID=A0A2P2NVX5_RHIMU